jgi:hypothetical protein
MPPLDRRVSVGLDQLRAEVQTRASETSLRKTAAEIGIGLTGLRGFLSGADPYGPNLEKLRAWYEWRMDGVDLAVRVHKVLGSLTPAQRAQAVTELRRMLGDWTERWNS